MLKFDMETIPHKYQRYDTVGDYATDIFGTVHFRVSSLNNWKFELLVAVHEVVEKFLCKAKNIHEIDIDSFDIHFEKHRLGDSTAEPGDDPEAPYHNEHVFATEVERSLADKLGVNWEEYEKAIYSLEYPT